VAFVSDRGGTRDVFLADLAGGAVTRLTNTPDRDEFAPRWSPDGERLVLTTAPPQPPGRDGDRLDPAATRLVVVDRSGRVLFETPGMMADWMPGF
jgi:Tol biopolymer transport system component